MINTKMDDLDQGVNNFTRFLDNVYQEKLYKDEFHYIMKLSEFKYAIRIPGLTIGALSVDEFNIIHDIHIASDVRNLYPEDIEIQLEKFIKEKLVFTW